MDLPPAPDVAGISLSSTVRLSISAEENAALCRSTGVEPDPQGFAHPIYYFIATQVGMGKTVAGLCEACEFDINDGPMMGTSAVTFSAPIRTGQPYGVTGRILSLTRKLSRKLGVMDLLEYELQLCPPDGEPVLTTINSWVLPRRNLA